jgi:hypothetical protein
VHEWVDADCLERLEVEVLDVVRRRLDDDLVLVVMLQAKRVIAIATICRPSAGLRRRLGCT